MQDTHSQQSYTAGVMAEQNQSMIPSSCVAPVERYIMYKHLS